jgi:hypothetical protein
MTGDRRRLPEHNVGCRREERSGNRREATEVETPADIDLRATRTERAALHIHLADDVDDRVRISVHNRALLERERAEVVRPRP